MKTILVTGAGGLVATQLICQLLEKKNSYRIIALSTHPDVLKERYKEVAEVQITDMDHLSTTNEVQIDVCIHAAFSRNKNAADIASSLQFTSEILKFCKNQNVPLFVNISSQSVYGQITSPLWTEQAIPSPDYLYAMGKYSTEVLTETAFYKTSIKHTNIRLSSVSENARFLNVFVKNAIEGKPIVIQGGTQQVSFIDVRDVAAALIKLIEKGMTIDLKPVYNLGTGKTRTILQLANDVKRIFKSDYGKNVTVEVQPSDLVLDVGMNPQLFENTFDWHPVYDYDDMIISLILLNNNQLPPPTALLKNPNTEYTRTTLKDRWKMPSSYAIVYKHQQYQEL